jgi:hypothetical protein
MSRENVDIVRRVFAELGPNPGQADPSALARVAAPELRDAHEITIRDGLFTRVKVYLDRAQALEAAGLRE